ncbi:transaldolase family protein [Clostridium sp. YIM B02551]|uniref:transaldolase family protein n=1 Tax=Clostridium sp. YIM B02551 TaxID=2910679 RepID=UPI001EEAD1CC|nr:transaldolase family protein [Clostridium sp. YIM B02551]
MFLDTANINEIKEISALGFFKGVTTNPTLLLKEKKNREVIINEIYEAYPKMLFVQAVGETHDEIYNDCKRILQIDSTRIVLKIPATVEGMKVITSIKRENRYTPILATAVCSVEQGIISVLAGCDYIAPYVNRMESNNINPYEVINKIRKYIDENKVDTKIVAASFKNPNQVNDAIFSGAHTVTIPYDILNQMLNKQLVVASVDKFNKDGYELEALGR